MNKEEKINHLQDLMVAIEPNLIDKDGEILLSEVVGATGMRIIHGFKGNLNVDNANVMFGTICRKWNGCKWLKDQKEELIDYLITIFTYE